jgi:MerC mercury resistance protein
MRTEYQYQSGTDDDTTGGCTVIALLVAALEHPGAERVGRFLALGCAVHCAFTPLLLAVLPTAAAASGLAAGLEPLLVGASLALAAGTLSLGYRRHRRARPLLLLAAGALLAVAGLLWHEAALGPGLTASGLLLLLPANLLDRRLRDDACPLHGPHRLPSQRSGG